jgi:hypothetical protein
MAADIEVTSNDDLVGFNIVYTFDEDYPNGYLYAVRITPTEQSFVRGLHGITYDDFGPTYSIVDTEVGLDVPISYYIVHIWTDEYDSPGTTVVISENNTLDTPSAGDFVLRNLFLPTDEAIKDVEVGTIQDTTINIRSSEFSVLGRPDPVVIVDTVDSERSTLWIETKSQAEREEIKRLTRTGSPMMLQSLRVYDIGSSGVLYFQPKKIFIKRLTTFGEEQYRRFEIEYVQVSRPLTAVLFNTPTRSYDDIEDAYFDYLGVLAGVPNYFELLYEPVGS